MVGAAGEVLLLSSVPPPTGGISIWTQRFLDAAPRHGLQVRLQSVGPRDETELFDRSVAVHLRRGFEDVVRPLASIVARRPAILHVCVSSGTSFLVGVAYAAVGAALRLPTVIHVHGSLALCSTRAIAVARRMAASPHVVFVTPSVADARVFDFLVQIDNFVPRNADRLPRVAEGTTLRLVYMGWMTRSKGIFELAEAVGGMSDVSLDLYGPVVKPDELYEWQAFVNRSNAADVVRYRGVLPSDEVIPSMASYDALALASHSESFGLAAAEAMMNGIPVLATPTGFVADLPDDCYVALPFHSAIGIRRVIATVAAHRNRLRDTTVAAFRSVSSRLGEEVTFGHWLALYERISRHKPLQARTPVADAVPRR